MSKLKELRELAGTLGFRNENEMGETIEELLGLIEVMRSALMEVDYFASREIVMAMARDALAKLTAYDQQTEE